MKLFNELKLKFEKPDWAKNPEFGLIDTILESNPNLYEIVKEDILAGQKENTFGRKDNPTVEQIVRAAIYKEMKILDYRELEYAQSDSRICATFIKLDERKPFSFSLFQQYISRIKAESLEQLMVAINKIGILEGLEDVKKIRVDSTVVKSDIKHPTNNSLIWDCIHECHRLLEHLAEECNTIDYRDYRTSAKKLYYKINITRSGDKQADLFRQQLITFTKCINQVANTIKKKVDTVMGMIFQSKLKRLLPLMEQVYDMAYRKQILGEQVPNDEKIFSIYELHTDIIVKGSREIYFGHKVNFVSGRSNLILDCEIPRGNPSDINLYPSALDRIEKNYQIIPRDSATDGGYACKANLEYAQGKGIVNIVFNKVKGSMQNICSSKHLETSLKKWRSGMEAVISNIKRGFNLRVCNWKGWEHFQAKVMWSVIAYNFRVMTTLVVQQLQQV
jgi:IS5 family transposase